MRMVHNPHNPTSPMPKEVKPKERMDKNSILRDEHLERKQEEEQQKKREEEGRTNPHAWMDGYDHYNMFKHL